jgi:hypothetical protein
MPAETQFFMIWCHRNADSLFGASSKPVVRNGSFLCYQSETSARAECDRLNAAAGAGLAHYNVRPISGAALKTIADSFAVLPRPTTADCSTTSRTPLPSQARRHA